MVAGNAPRPERVMHNSAAGISVPKWGGQIFTRFNGRKVLDP